MSVIGVDFSLTATGVCTLTDSEAETVTIRSTVEETWWKFPDRAREIADGIRRWAALDDVPDIWVIESPSFGSKGQLDRMFAGWWILIDTLTNVHGWPTPIRVTPGQLKKWATGSGNANKDAVLLAVARRYPDVTFKNNDEADALVLASIGAAVLNEPFNGPLTKYQEVIVDDLRTGGKGKK